MSNNSSETLDVRRETDPVKNRPTQQEVFPSVTREALRKNPNASEVAQELGIHIATVYRHAKGMDLKLIRELKKSDWDVKHIIRQLKYDMNLKPSVIAKKLGYTLPYVSQVLAEQDSEAA